MKLKSSSILDIFGISSATVCLVHCLIFPLLSILPFGFTHNHWIDIAFACIGIFVVSRIIISKANIFAKIILSISILLVTTGILLELLYDKETGLVIVGGFIMIIGHIVNFLTHDK